jgi:hypothetical protein
MDMVPVMTEQNSRSTYEAPRLVEYGSVRNLTGGSGGGGNDGALGMTMA